MRLRGEGWDESGPGWSSRPVSHPRGNEKLEELSTLKTSPETQQFHLLAQNWRYTTNTTYSHTLIVKPVVNQRIKYRLCFCLSWRLKESGRNKSMWFIYLFVLVHNQLYFSSASGYGICCHCFSGSIWAEYLSCVDTWVIRQFVYKLPWWRLVLADRKSVV